MTAFYIGQHEIDDEAAFADYLKETMPFIERHGGSPKLAHMKCSKGNGRAASSLSNFRASRRLRISTRSRLSAADRQAACSAAQRYDCGGGPVKLWDDPCVQRGTIGPEIQQWSRPAERSLLPASKNQHRLGHSL